MRSLFVFTWFAAALLGIALAGCSKKPVAKLEAPEEAPPEPTAVEIPAETPAVAADTAQPLLPPVAPPEPSAQEKYDAALLEALNYMADKKYTEALVSLGTAKAAQNNERVQQEIDKVKALIDQQISAQQTAQDIKTVINEGSPEDAANLATTSLKQFGGTDTADSLASLKREADALTATQQQDTAGRQAHFRQEAQAALAERNLRAAAIACEQALQYGDDPGLRRQFDDIQGSLNRYDENRKRAAELRRDPAHLEDAIAALQEAARAWDTVQVREEIDLYTLALQKRREAISVADFEIRGDVGIPFAGRTIAEELLPAFRPRFDLVERSQISKVLDELRLEASSLAGDDNCQREVGRLAKVRYLVLGSVTPLCGITVNARLVDVRSGLVVQTAKMVVRTPEEILRSLPQLANQLLMTDEQKCAYEQQLIQRPAVIVEPVVIAPLPPPPVFGQPPPPPIIAYTPCPPPVGGLVAADLNALPLPGGALLSAQFVAEREGPVKNRLLQVAVSLGDNLFRRGRYQEAHRHFELALNIAPGEFDLRLRLDRCRAQLPPPPPPPLPTVVIVNPPPVIVVAPRPRMAVLNFVINADPMHAPPGFGDWAADHLASYFAPSYEVVDRGELFWYMGRLGLSVRDVAVDVSARQWLGRALNVRYFAFGIVQQTASFNVTTHLVDVESGAQHGLGSIHVQDQQELKLRMAELASQVRANPADKARIGQQAQENERQLNQVRQLLKAGQTAQAIQASQEALKRQPNNVAMLTLLNQAQQQDRAAALAQAQQREAEQRKAQLAALQRQQAELARAAQAARQKAQQEAATRDETSRRAKEQQKLIAYQQLLTQGQTALRQQNYQLAAARFQSAVALNAGAEGQRLLADARAQADLSAKQQADALRARQAADVQRQHEAELARARAQVEEQRRQREAQELAQRNAQEARDQAAAAKLADESKRLLSQGKVDAAVASLQSARQLHPSKDMDALLNQALEKSAAAKQDAKARAEQARLMAAEQARRAESEAVARRNRDLYTAALQQAQQAFVAKRYDQAIARYQEADKLFHTDAVLNGLRQVKDAQAKDQALAEMARQKQIQEQKKGQTPPVQPKVTMLPPPQPKTPPRPQPPAPNAVAYYAKQIQAAAAYEKQQKYDEAMAAYKEALRYVPNDREATAGLHLAGGQKALKAKRFIDAAKEFQEVLKVSPNNAEAANGLKRAKQGR